jgi:hypothetical protein
MSDAAILDLIDDDHDAPNDNRTDELFARLDAMVARQWQRAGETEFWRHVTANGFTPELYRDLMVQIFHYTRFNSLNQAQSVMRVRPEQRALLRFAYRHADEELGHETMVVHDLRAVGLIDDTDDITTHPRVPATDALINYLAGLSCTDGAVARLGYSYWAEDVYTFIAPLLRVAQTSLQLTERHMTFFVAHSAIDAGHSAEVRRIIAKVAITPEERDAVYRVAETTLWLTTQIMAQAFDQWRDRSDGDG